MGNGDRPTFGFQLSPVQGMGIAPSSEPNPFGYNLVRPSLIAPPEQQASSFSPQEYADGEAELKLLHQFFPFPGDKIGTPYVAHGPTKGTLTYDIVRYLTDRNVFFGSIADYRNYLIAATAELDADDVRIVGKGKKQQTKVRHDPLRAVVDPNIKRRHGAWRECQNVYYAWVRKAYENAVGPTVNVPQLIKAGKTQALINALQKVQATTKTNLNMGGFNARPIKLNNVIKLGTISDHAFGTAVDVDDTRNAQINQHDWAVLESYTAQPATTNVQRLATWTANPQDLYDSVVLINDTFVQNLQNDKTTHGSIAQAKKKQADLKKLLNFDLVKWESGFFTLPWDLVDAFHQAGLTWGATFPDVDLHHFQL